MPRNLGGLIALLAAPVGSILVYILPLADILILLLGILLLLDKNPFKTLPQIQLPVLRHPYINAYVYGLLMVRLRFLVLDLWLSVFLPCLSQPGKRSANYGYSFGLGWVLACPS
jgi:hypothetical protein